MRVVIERRALLNSGVTTRDALASPRGGRAGLGEGEIIQQRPQRRPFRLREIPERGQLLHLVTVGFSLDKFVVRVPRDEGPHAMIEHELESHGLREVGGRSEAVVEWNITNR